MKLNKIKMLLVILLGLTLLGAPLTGQDDATNDDPASDAPEMTGPPDFERPRPDWAADIEIPEELKEMIASFRAEQQAIREEMHAYVAESLADVENPTREQIQEARQEFLTENADRILAQRELGAEIKAELADLRPDGVRPDRPRSGAEGSTEFRRQRKQILIAQRALRIALSNPELTEEQREEAIATYRQQQSEYLMQLREMRRDLRRAARENIDGDRRPDDDEDTDTGGGDGG